jgi:hypothetical protein
VLCQAAADPLRREIVAFAERRGEDDDEATGRRLPGASVIARWVVIGAVAAGGWGWGAYEHFVLRPASADAARIGTTLDLVDRFVDTPAHHAYDQLADDLRPWWEQIDELQRKIQSAPDDAGRDAMIAERDASLVRFVGEHGLAPKLDLLIGSFDEFTRCLDTGGCDEETLARAISIDVKRIWRTFRPYVLHRRGNGRPEDRDYGRHLEDLYFRFVG